MTDAEVVARAACRRYGWEESFACSVWGDEFWTQDEHGRVFVGTEYAAKINYYHVNGAVVVFDAPRRLQDSARTDSRVVVPLEAVRSDLLV